MKTYSRLYKVDSKGKLRFWDQVVFDQGGHSEIRSTHGLSGGSPVSEIKREEYSSVLGHYPRALALADTKWKNKRDSGYCLTEEDAKCFVPTRPMLSKTSYINQPKTIEKLLPCISQRKLDGVRAQWFVGASELVSRKGKPWNRVDHISHWLRQFGSIELDAELYVHGMPLQDIVHWVKTKDASGKLQIQLVIFDSPSRNSKDTYVKRMLRLSKWYATLPNGAKEYIKLLGFDYVATLEQAGSFFDQCVADGYEGMMLKDPDDSYHWDKRVIGSTKVKPVFSDEFTILRANANNSTGQDLIEFVCLTSDSKEFKVVPAWPKNMRNICCTNLDRYQGEALTIEYRGLSKAGIPLHPVGITVRDYEE